MAGATLTINYSAPLDVTSGAVSPGQCLLANAAGNYVPATLTNRNANPYADIEVALTASVAGGASQTLSLGRMPTGVYNLGAGTATTVGPDNTTGMLVRDAAVSIGTCNALGGCTLGNLAAVAGAAAGVFSVKSYGAKGDGAQDDTAFIQAAITAAGAVGTATTRAVVDFPRGTYKVTAMITVLDNVELTSSTGGATLLQTGPVLAGGRVTGAYDILRIPVGAPGYVSRNIEITKLRFAGQNSPFFQTILADQGAWAAIRVLESGSYPTDISVTDCEFADLYFNLMRTDGNGKRFVFTSNRARNCGGELNLNVEDQFIAGNTFDSVWAIESSGQSVAIISNKLSNCNSGISLGGSGGFQAYRRDDCGGAITDATNATPIVIACAGHGLVAGQSVSISGVVGNTAANIDGFAGTIVDANHFSLLRFGGGNTVGNGAYVSGGYVAFKGDFGCVVAGNLIDTTNAGNGITSGNPEVGALVCNNVIRRVAPGYHSIHCTTTVAYFAATGRLFSILDNVITASGGHGILVESGDGHVIARNHVSIGAMPYPSPVYGTGIGICVKNGAGDTRNVSVRDNFSRGRADDFLLDGPTLVDFRGNNGVLDLQNNAGEVSFARYEEPIGGIKITSGAPVFPSLISAIAYASDANKTITEAQYAQSTWNVTGTISVTRDLIAPLRQCTRLVANGAKDGGGTPQAVRVIGSSGTGATVAAGKTAWVWCDATNWYLGPST